MGHPSAKCPACGLTFEIGAYGRVVDHSCISYGLEVRARRSTLSPPPADPSPYAWTRRTAAPTDPTVALENVRTAIAAEMSRSRVQADALDDLERLVAQLERSCILHVSQAREAGRKAGFALGLDRAAEIADGCDYGKVAAAEIRKLAKEF